MRGLTTADKVRRLMRELGHAASGPGRIYFTGGTSAVLVGWRPATHDVDLKLDPEPPGVFGAIPRLKQELDINIELAAPEDFRGAASWSKSAGRSSSCTTISTPRRSPRSSVATPRISATSARCSRVAS